MKDAGSGLWSQLGFGPLGLGLGLGVGYCVFFSFCRVSTEEPEHMLYPQMPDFGRQHPFF